MLMTLTSIGPEEASKPLLWVVAWARGVARDALRAHLGAPTYIETDGRCTFGGEEDWWEYRTARGDSIAVCLRVPYEDAVLYVSDPVDVDVREGASLLAPWAVEVFDVPSRR